VKIIASWPNYGSGHIVAVCEDGSVYSLPTLDSGMLVATEWLLLATAIGGKQKSAIQRFEDALSRYTERSTAEPKILLLSPRDIDRMGQLMREDVRFPMSGGWHMRFNGIELARWLGVEEGTVVVCAADFQVLGSFAWPK